MNLSSEDGKSRQVFVEKMIEDRMDNSFSYFEFLQHIKQQIKWVDRMSSNKFFSNVFSRPRVLVVASFLLIGFKVCLFSQDDFEK